MMVERSNERPAWQLDGALRRGGSTTAEPEARRLAGGDRLDLCMTTASTLVPLTKSLGGGRRSPPQTRRLYDPAGWITLSR